MKKDENTLLPKAGFSKLRFGMKQDEVIELLGEPESKEESDDEGDIIYQYPSIGIESVCFDKEEDFKVSVIELNEKSSAILWGEKPFDLSVEELKSLSEKSSYTLEHDIHSENLSSHTLYTVDDLSLDFYFNENKKLESIVLGIFVDENDQIEWPPL